jgi:hypothetical protein
MTFLGLFVVVNCGFKVIDLVRMHCGNIKAYFLAKYLQIIFHFATVGMSFWPPNLFEPNQLRNAQVPSVFYCFM